MLKVHPSATSTSEQQTTADNVDVIHRKKSCDVDLQSSSKKSVSFLHDDKIETITNTSNTTKSKMRAPHTITIQPILLRIRKLYRPSSLKVDDTEVSKNPNGSVRLFEKNRITTTKSATKKTERSSSETGYQAQKIYNGNLFESKYYSNSEDAISGVQKLNVPETNYDKKEKKFFNYKLVKLDKLDKNNKQSTKPPGKRTSNVSLLNTTPLISPADHMYDSAMPQPQANATSNSNQKQSKAAKLLRNIIIRLR